MTSELTRLLDPVIAIARAAGEAIMKVYTTDFDVTQKDDSSPLTEADMAAHLVISTGLATLTPDWPLLSEEGADGAFSERVAWEQYWLVDPLDGTREFVKRNGDFTVNIALIREQRVVLGVVYVPVTGVCYFAAASHGAFKQEPDGPALPIHARSLTAKPIQVVGSRSHRGASLDEFLLRLGDYEMLSVGSSLKLCMVAEGRADIYPRLGLTSEWDTAAAQCIVEAAGGFVTDTVMQPLRYNTKESLLNPFFLVYGDASKDWSCFVPEALTVSG